MKEAALELHALPSCSRARISSEVALMEIKDWMKRVLPGAVDTAVVVAICVVT